MKEIFSLLRTFLQLYPPSYFTECITYSKETSPVLPQCLPFINKVDEEKSCQTEKINGEKCFSLQFYV